MKKNVFYLVLLALSLFSCRKDILPHGDITKLDKSILGFTAIEIEDGFTAIVRFDGLERIEVETYENMQRYVIVRKIGNKLQVKRSGDVHFEDHSMVTVYISAKLLNEVCASGGSRVDFMDSLVTDELMVNLSGGSVVNVDVKCDNLLMNLSGGSVMKANGLTDYMDVDVSGGSRLECFGLQAKKLSCNASGGSRLHVQVLERLDVTASGGSVVTYKGTGVVERDEVSGGSEVKRY